MPDAPRTDPCEKDYFTRLLPRVIDARPLVNHDLTYPVKSVQCLSLSLCTGRRRLARIPLGHQPSLQNFRRAIGPLCSAPSSVLRRCQTAQQRACRDYGHWPSPTDPMCTSATDAAELSRFSNIECLRMHRVSDSAGPGDDWQDSVVARDAFPIVERGRHPGLVISELNGWPALPLSTLHVRPRGRPRMTRGHDGSAHPFT